MSRDADFMAQALMEAERAASMGEVPVGAVIVYQGKIISSGWNAPITLSDPSAHAEMQAIRAAARHLGNYRLPECELFVTLEPCLMCAGAIFHARLKRVVFATHDPKTGVAGSLLNMFAEPQLNHHTLVESGVMATEAAQQLSGFFARRRAEIKASKLNQPDLSR